MSAQRAIIWLLFGVSALLAVPGAWITVEHLLEAWTFQQWATVSGCRIAASRFDWCGPERLAEAAETAAEHMQAAVHYAPP